MNIKELNAISRFLYGNVWDISAECEVESLPELLKHLGSGYGPIQAAYVLSAIKTYAMGHLYRTDDAMPISIKPFDFNGAKHDGIFIGHAYMAHEFFSAGGPSSIAIINSLWDITFFTGTAATRCEDMTPRFCLHFGVDQWVLPRSYPTLLIQNGPYFPRRWMEELIKHDGNDQSGYSIFSEKVNNEYMKNATYAMYSGGNVDPMRLALALELADE